MSTTSGDSYQTWQEVQEHESRPQMERVVLRWLRQFHTFTSPEDEATFFQENELWHHGGWTYSLYLPGYAAYPGPMVPGENRSIGGGTQAVFAGHFTGPRGIRAQATWTMRPTYMHVSDLGAGEQVSGTYRQTVECHGDSCWVSDITCPEFIIQTRVLPPPTP